MSNLFLISWDCEGVETVLNISDFDKQRVWATLSNQSQPVGLRHMVSHVIMRARANPQRHYEVYTMDVQEGITEADVREMFDTDPQGSADLVRDRGRCIHSDRVDNSRVRIV